MRTTLTISDDLSDAIKERAGRTKRPVKAVINEALRLGLEAMDRPRATAYRTDPVSMGPKPGVDFDNIGDLLTVAEGEDHR